MQGDLISPSGQCSPLARTDYSPQTSRSHCKHDNCQTAGSFNLEAQQFTLLLLASSPAEGFTFNSMIFCVVLQALQAAMDLEPMLLGPVAAAAPGCHHPATCKTLGECTCTHAISVHVAFARGRGTGADNGMHLLEV